MKSNSERVSKMPTTVGAAAKSYKELLVERRGERVLLVQFNRYTVRNALNRRAYYELIRILLTVAHDPNVTIVVLTGVGDAFSAGNDLSETVANLNDVCKLSADPVEIEKTRLKLNQEANFVLRCLVQAFIFCPKILVALVNGVSFGMGFTIAALCDIVYCTENAYFEASFTQLGLCPEACSSFLFPRIFGRSKSMEILTLGTRLTAQEALKYKFVSRIFKNHDELESHFWPKILEYSLLPPKSMETSKRLLFKPIRGDLLTALMAEIKVLEQVRLGPIHSYEIQKFVQKSKGNKSKL